MKEWYKQIISLFILLPFFALHIAKAQEKENSSPKIIWHSYMQLRGTTDFEGDNNFSVRRLKFWIKPSPSLSKRWDFKVQAIFMSVMKEKFFLQDVYVKYRFWNSNLQFGQFIPKFSLQRFQPDYLIPSAERSRAVSLLIPNGTLGVRDIGIQYNLKTAKQKLELNAGVFNGYGIKDYRFNNKGILLTHNLSYTFELPKSKIKAGYSVMYRYADDINFAKIFEDTLLYSGNDFRFGLYSMFNSRHFDIQAEYIRAFFENSYSDGYYALATIKFTEKHQMFLSYDGFFSSEINSLNNPWYIAGYNFLIKEYKLMLTLDTRFSKQGEKLKNITVIQFQMFIN